MTPLGFKVVQCRLSLKETQEQFAERFRVTTATVCKWERGGVEVTHKIYTEILDLLHKRLKQEGRLISEYLIKQIFSDTMSTDGDASK